MHPHGPAIAEGFDWGGVTAHGWPGASAQGAGPCHGQWPPGQNSDPLCPRLGSTGPWALPCPVNGQWPHRHRMTVCYPSFPRNMADSKAKPAKATNKTPPKSPGDPAKDKATKRLSLESEGAPEGAAAAPELSALEEAFRRFAVHGDTRATGREMHGKNWSKLCKDCQVIDGKNVTVTDVDIVFSKIK